MKSVWIKWFFPFSTDISVAGARHHDPHYIPTQRAITPNLVYNPTARQSTVINGAKRIQQSLQHPQCTLYSSLFLLQQFFLLTWKVTKDPGVPVVLSMRKNRRDRWNLATALVTKGPKNQSILATVLIQTNLLARNQLILKMLFMKRHRERKQLTLVIVVWRNHFDLGRNDRFYCGRNLPTVL